MSNETPKATQLRPGHPQCRRNQPHRHTRSRLRWRCPVHRKGEQTSLTRQQAGHVGSSMPSLRTYDLFISHAWSYGDDYYRIVD